jgi:hypothetical protein
MTYEEFLRWQAYFEARPIDWRDDMRIMKILQSLGIKAKPEAVFESLAQLKASQEEYEARVADSERLMRSLKGSVLFSRLLGAAGGDTPAFLNQL